MGDDATIWLILQYFAHIVFAFDDEKKKEKIPHYAFIIIIIYVAKLLNTRIYIYTSTDKYVSNETRQ